MGQKCSHNDCWNKETAELNIQPAAVQEPKQNVRQKCEDALREKRDENDDATTPRLFLMQAAFTELSHCDLHDDDFYDSSQNPLEPLPGYFAREVPELRSLAVQLASKPNGFRKPYQFATGSVYSGEWKGHFRHGTGRHEWKDGTVYEGEWYINNAEGKGRLLHSNGDVYIGTWAKNLAHGLGIYYSDGKVRYCGSWFNDMQQGLGIEHAKCDRLATYEGQFKGGLKDGVGSYTWTDGSQYFGSWSNNCINGLGIYIGDDNRWFKGSWCDSTMHGPGKYVWPDGREYVGNYANDKKSGFGTYAWPNGKKYCGYWKDGRQHGVGKIVKATGGTLYGTWRNGEIAPGQALFASSRTISTNFSITKSILKGSSNNIRSGSFTKEDAPRSFTKEDAPRPSVGYFAMEW